MKSLSVTIQMKATGTKQCFSGAVYYVVQGGSRFCVRG